MPTKLINGLFPSAAKSAEGLALGTGTARSDAALGLRALRRDAVRDTRGCIPVVGLNRFFSSRSTPEPIGKVS
jgi:hypothetical protein